MSTLPKKHTLLFLAGVGVVIAGLLTFVLFLSFKGREGPSFDSELQELRTQSSDDSVDSIEKDLNETDLEDVDKELQSIEDELNKAAY